MSRAIARRAGFLALLVAAAAAVACSSDLEKAAEHLSRAEAYQAEGKQKEALLELRSALQLDPQSSDTNFRIGAVLESQQQFGDAAFYYAEAYRLDKNATRAALAEARLISFADTARARTLVDEVLVKEPDNAHAHVQSSHLALVVNDSNAALTAALTATEFAPEDAEAWHQLGIVHQARMREMREGAKVEPADEVFEAAITAFERAAEHGSPRQAAAALRERGRVLASWPGHEAKADAAFRELVERTDASGDAALAREGALAAGLYARRTRNLPLLRWSLERLVAADPSDVRAWDELARLSETKEAGEAVLARMIEQRPADSEAQIAYARGLVRADRNQDAIAHLEGVAEEVDEPAAILGFLVDLHYTIGQPDKAAELVARLEAEYPESPRTALARGQRLMGQGAYDEAATLLREVAGKNESAQGQYLLAMAEHQRGRLGDASQAIERALELGAGTAQERSILSVRVQIQYALRNWAELLQTANTLARMQGFLSDRVRLMRVEAFFELGREELALRALAHELKSDAPAPDTVLVFARYRRAAEPERARALLEGALQRRPDDPRLRTALAEIELASGRGEQALEMLDQALAKAPAGPQSALLHAQRAQVLLGLGRLEDAEAAALSAFQAEPGNLRNGNLLVAIYAEQGRLAEAVTRLEEVQQVGALPGPAEELLARLYAQVGREDDALALYERLIQQDASRASAKNDLAYLLAKRGSDLDRALELARDAKEALGDDPSAADTLGFVYYRKALYEPAIEQFRSAIAAAEKRPAIQASAAASYHYHLGLALRELDRKGEAIEAMKAAVARNPDYPEAKQALAELEGGAGGAGAPQGSS